MSPEVQSLVLMVDWPTNKKAKDSEASNSCILHLLQEHSKVFPHLKDNTGNYLKTLLTRKSIASLSGKGLGKKRKTHLFGIENNLLELARFCKTLNHFVWDVCPQIDTEGKGWVGRLYEISQLLGAFELKKKSNISEPAKSHLIC